LLVVLAAARIEEETLEKTVALDKVLLGCLDPQQL
jgi:hypothetical protein